MEFKGNLERNFKGNLVSRKLKRNFKWKTILFEQHSRDSVHRPSKCSTSIIFLATSGLFLDVQCDFLGQQAKLNNFWIFRKSSKMTIEDEVVDNWWGRIYEKDFDWLWSGQRQGARNRWDPILNLKQNIHLV